MNLRVVFMGSPEFAVPTLAALHANFQVIGVFTQPDKPKGRGRKPLPTAVKIAALEMGLPVSEPQDVRSPETVALLAEWKPDAIVVAAYGKILPEQILDLPPMGCVNLHASFLPRYRGASPIPAAILAGDEFAGVSTMLMNKGMDTGDILLQRTVPVDKEDTAGSLHDKLLEPGADLVVQTLKKMHEGTIEPQPQDHSQASYTRPMSKEDGRLQWQQDAEHLDRVVRAMNPWPGAFFLCSEEPIRVWKAAPKHGAASPGFIAGVREDGIAVGTGKGLLILREVQAPGKKRIAASDFARGRRLKEGDRFD
ncbi:MAG: methionyl-tRNA formyltransferase [Desulfomonile tiedjei]|nr:methionyl-tRNA formyltransferase [Desulfomonile tiedjei]